MIVSDLKKSILQQAFQGNLSIKGKIYSVNYLEESGKNKTDHIMARLFK